MSIKLSSVTSKDYHELAKFLAQFPDEKRDFHFWYKRLLYWWDQNPTWSQNVERGWILREEKSTSIVGFIGNIPTLFLINHVPTTVFNMTTWRVLPSYRYASLQLIYKQITNSQKSILFLTTPNKDVRHITQLLDFLPIPFSSHLKTNIWIYFDAFLGKKLATMARAIFLHLKWKKMKHRNSDFKVVKLNDANSDFDELWEKTKSLYKNTNVRTSHIIKWYCFQGPGESKHLWGCYDKKELVGYAIAWIYQTQNIKELECLDLWGMENTEIAKNLINEMVHFAEGEKIDRIGIPHFAPHSNAHLKLFGSIKTREMKNKDFFWADKELKSTVLAKHSYFVRAQGDIGL